MTEIKFRGCTYGGTAEGDHGVFTDSDGRVFAGQIAGDYACVGVVTWPDGSTSFAECDADGEEHGRVLDCYADGDTVYSRFEHGSAKEHALLRADGTCTYNKPSLIANAVGVLSPVAFALSSMLASVLPTQVCAF